MRSRIRVAAAATAVLVLGTVAAAYVWQPWRKDAALPGPKVNTQTVMREALTSNTILNAQLSYGDPDTLIGGGGGILTVLPPLGKVVKVGQRVYETDGRPVVLLKGARPFWRELRTGVSPGEDVRQLERNLVKLGSSAGLTVDDTFTRSTALAIKRWQDSLRVKRTGVFAPGDAVVTKADAIRVETIHVKLGASANGDILDYTDTAVLAFANLSTAQAGSLMPGKPVTVALPDGSTTGAQITQIQKHRGSDKDGKLLPDRAVIEFADQSPVSRIGLSAVRVTIPSDTVDGALVVPVTALLALADGGYGVEVLRDGKRVLVPVKVGLVADSRLQITGDIKEGEEVVAP
ncbi:peptidoglycan-binding protein [Micromonospora peucetia]|uniref:Peptidoglycan-binding protein n=1 Tax=Micromonospora peucetia TaxID=47871 RepID=A0ABZ1EF26_9ACTN|nr:peptidoglycan-binding protein [Micromonospora peucetia]WSA33149.1 peptidoglycan-binding protein [Micromonospora peucetia]